MEAREMHAKSIEAMVMTIPYINKIRVLSKISPPLQPPAPTSPAQETRGAVVAIEGQDRELLAEVGAFIREYLTKDPSFTVRIWTAPPPPPPPSNPNPNQKRISCSPSQQASDMEMIDGSSSSPTQGPHNNLGAEEEEEGEEQEEDPFIEAHVVIQDWLRKSRQITKFITTIPNPPSPHPPPNHNPNPHPKILPIALLPTGFSLTTSDYFAVKCPINDSYAPIDHWQWMATLFRGIVGPDLTVYVTRAGREEVQRWGGVDIKSDCAAIVVRVGEAGKMDEKTSRRLGFEVVEFVRGVEGGGGMMIRG